MGKGRRKITTEEVRQFAQEQGDTLISEYLGCRDLLRLQCPKGHIYEKTWVNYKGNGQRCHFCSGGLLHQGEVERVMAIRGDRLTRFTPAQGRTPAIVEGICPKGHPFSTNWWAYKKRNCCRECWREGQRRTPEEEAIADLRSIIRNAVNDHLNRQSSVQGKRTSKHKFAQSVAEKLYSHLGDRPEGHHIDHIIPQSFFDFRDPSQLSVCWAIQNLRYLDSAENLVRGNRLQAEEITPELIPILMQASLRPKKWDKWLAEQGHPIKSRKLT